MATAGATKRKSVLAEDEDADFEQQQQQGRQEERQERPSAAKKGKTSKAGSKEFPFELSERRRVTVRTFGGKVLIDIREYYTDQASGEERPGKKGIALSPDQWEALKALVNDIDDAVAQLS